MLWQSFYENVAQALAALPNLQAFELSGMHWGSLMEEDTERVWQSKPFVSALPVNVGGEEGDGQLLVGDVDSEHLFAY